MGWMEGLQNGLDGEKAGERFISAAGTYEKAIPFCRLHASGSSYTNTLLLALHRRGGGLGRGRPVRGVRPSFVREGGRERAAGRAG